MKGLTVSILLEAFAQARQQSLPTFTCALEAHDWCAIAKELADEHDLRYCTIITGKKGALILDGVAVYADPNAIPGTITLGDK